MLKKNHGKLNPRKVLNENNPDPGTTNHWGYSVSKVLNRFPKPPKPFPTTTTTIRVEAIIITNDCRESVHATERNPAIQAHVIASTVAIITPVIKSMLPPDIPDIRYPTPINCTAL